MLPSLVAHITHTCSMLPSRMVVVLLRGAQSRRPFPTLSWSALGSALLWSGSLISRRLSRGGRDRRGTLGSSSVMIIGFGWRGLQDTFKGYGNVFGFVSSTTYGGSDRLGHGISQEEGTFLRQSSPPPSMTFSQPFGGILQGPGSPPPLFRQESFLHTSLDSTPPSPLTPSKTSGHMGISYAPWGGLPWIPSLSTPPLTGLLLVMLNATLANR